MVLSFWLGVAHAAVPVGAVMEPSDVVEQYRLHAMESGRSGAAAELVCKTAIESLQICATVMDGAAWRYASLADLGVERPTAMLDEHGFRSKDAEGVGRYWTREKADGKEGMIYVQPGLLSELSPVGVVVAWPVPGVVIAWVPGNPNLDQVMSVGVAQMVEASNHPISSVIYRYLDNEWKVWGEAKKPKPASP
jgi:hypothetical protein